MHYKDGDSWKDIDNRLCYDEKTGALHTSANAYDTALTAIDDGRPTVSLVRRDVEFAFSYCGKPAGVKAEIQKPEKGEYATEQEARADLSEKLHSGVKYTELRPGMDVEIHIDGKGLKDDIIGNPLSDGTWTYSWQAGRQLKSMSKVEGSNTVMMEFTYNHEGFRTKKVKKVNGVVKETTEYILNGKNVVELIHTDSTTGTTPTVNKLHFYYDAQGRVALVDFNGTKYTYDVTLQVMGIAVIGTIEVGLVWKNMSG